MNFVSYIGNSNTFYDSEPPNLVEPGTTGQTLVFLNDTGLVVPCRASGTPLASTTWILASKLFDATELYSTSDLINNLNSQEPSHHDYHHRTHLHRSTSHRLLNDELFVNLNSLNDKEQPEFIVKNLTSRVKRSINKATNFQSLNERPIDWLNEHFKLKELPGLRYVRGDGALVFPPFASSFYSPSVHHTGYVCVAWNQGGTIISAQINIKAGKHFVSLRFFFVSLRFFCFSNNFFVSQSFFLFPKVFFVSQRFFCFSEFFLFLRVFFCFSKKKLFNLFKKKPSPIL